jgi:hypothetical protein
MYIFIVLKTITMKKIICGFALALSMIVAGSTDANAQTKTKSRAGKNAAIGAAAGAVTGAAVSHHKGKGAIVGGAAGAAAGYAWGKHRDKKKGRKVVKD